MQDILEIFCSNAGIGGKPGFFEADTSDWDMIWGVNVATPPVCPGKMAGYADPAL